MKNATPELVAKYIEKNHNVMLMGDHGVGKTTIVREAAKKLGWKLVEFNAANMEPYIDLIGVPKTHTNEDGSEELRMVAKRNIMEADVIFMDELNRGRPETLNATMDMINDHMVSGTPLPNLKAVVAACNPPRSNATGAAYAVGHLDPAQLDRFTIHLSMSNRVNLPYFREAFPDNPRFAKALSDWQKSLDFDSKDARAPYISPRRMERLGKVFLEFPERDTIDHVLGADAERVTADSLYVKLSSALEADASNPGVDDDAEQDDDNIIMQAIHGTATPEEAFDAILNKARSNAKKK